MRLDCPTSRPDLRRHFPDHSKLPLDDLVEALVFTHGPLDAEQVTFALDTHFNREQPLRAIEILLVKLDKYGRLDKVKRSKQAPLFDHRKRVGFVA